MIHYETDSSAVVTLSIDMPGKSMNVINEALLEALEKQVERALSDASCKGVIITSAKDEFIAGADLEMLLPLKDAAASMALTGRLHRLFRRMEKSGKPFVAAINGTALGGGYELTLACHRRIALKNPKSSIGLPEVQLGLIPGGGGTQRLPRMIGIQNAVMAMTEGRKFDPEKALQSGLVDELADHPSEMMTKARQWILQNPSPEQPWDNKKFKIPGGGVHTPNGQMMFAAGTALLKQKSYGNYPAPLAIMSCVYEGLSLTLERGLEIEQRYFTHCLLSDVSKNMIRTLFFGVNACNRGVARPAGVGKTQGEIQKVGMLGAGMMGAGIAYATARAGLKIVLKDVSIQAAEKGKAYSEKLLDKEVARGKMTVEKKKEILDRIIPTDRSEELKGCELVIEAVFEDRALKAKVTAESEAVMSRDGVFASNTSTLPITGLAEASCRPESFIGLHFFSPVEKMPLVEIIMGKKTSDRALALSIDYVQKIRKTPIVVNDGRGFYTSRVFTTFINEGLACLEEGVHPALIENAARAAGMPVGPLAVADEVSIDLIYHIIEQTERDLGVESDQAAGRVSKLFVKKLNRLGRKNGKGFYDYPEGKEKALWAGLSDYFLVSSEQPSVEQLRRRILHIQALETVRCMEEGITTTARDADVGSIMGWGFPPYTGGVLSYIDTVGMKKIIDECNGFRAQLGKRFEVPPLLLKMAERGERFYK